MNDEFRFVVRSSPGGGRRKSESAAAMKSALETFSIHYLPGDDDIDVTLETLEVEEGAKKAVTQKYLDIRDGGLVVSLFEPT